MRAAAPVHSAQHRKARRRRRLTRQVRRLEAAVPPLRRLRGWKPKLDGLPALPHPAIKVSAAGVIGASGWHWSKAVSGLLLVGALAALVWLHTDWRWFVYRDTVHFGPLTYLSADELYPGAALEGWSIFWLQAERVAAAVEQDPFVRQADVRISLPNRVEVAVVEAAPVLLWKTGDADYWVLESGAALRIPDRAEGAPPTGPDGAELPQLVDLRRAAQVAGVADPAMEPAVVQSTLALIGRLPELHTVRYNQGVGLNFTLPGSPYWVYWGDGYHVEAKLENLAAGRALLAGGEEPGQVIDVRYPQRPYVR